MVADAPQRDIAKCYKFLLSDVKEKVEMVTPASLVRRFCSVLGLGLKEVKAAEEMARTAVPSEDSARCVELAAVKYSRSYNSNGCGPCCHISNKVTAIPCNLCLSSQFEPAVGLRIAVCGPGMASPLPQ